MVVFPGGAVMDRFERVRTLLDPYPKADVGFFPTPLHRLSNISVDLGVNLYMKREDFSGVNLFGGSKIRKLKYVLGQAVQDGIDVVVTYGATQSNHAMQTASACGRLGLRTILITAAIVEPDPDDLRANFLLDHVMGAEVHVVPVEQGDIASLTELLTDYGDQVAGDLERDGVRFVRIPPGANSVLGATGALEGYTEMIEQLTEADAIPDFVVHATGSGGTLAGFALGSQLVSSGETKIVSFLVSPLRDDYATGIVDVANEAAEKLGTTAGVSVDDLTLDDAHIGSGYEEPSSEASEAIQYLARREGILVGPVYTGKAFAGLLGWIESGRIPQGSNVVFFHSGGAQVLFAEPEIVGDITSEGVLPSAGAA
jgi:1-aminocyclopropane-1-carboxylate deaminase/D-cysteine desulfhydrase-like pyridoxal-dependent ACC family enzyme